jgi:hypothetical protein
MTIIKYIDAKNIIVQFENGFTVKSRYSHFKEGNIQNPIKNSKNRIGKTSTNNYGTKMTIIKYINICNILVQFQDKNHYITKTNYNDFIRGRVRNPYDFSVVNIGYIGEGDYKVSVNQKPVPQYKTWQNILERCYDEKALKKRPTYIGCIVCEEWHNFQNFAKWYDENYYTINNEQMCLDKDILVKGNKIYSPGTCVFVPENINLLFIKSNATRGKYPIGVSYDKSKNKFVSHCNNGKGKQIKLGIFNNSIDAFNAYKEFKENIIKDVAKYNLN